MIFAVYLGFGDAEDVVQEEGTEVGDVMPLPVLDATLEVLHCRVILGASLGLVDLISDALCSSDTSLELLRVRII